MHIHLWNLVLSFWHIFHGFLPYLIGGGGAAGGQTLWQKLRQRRAAAWPSADGEVQHAEVKAHNGYTVQIDYRYYARSEYHYGKFTRRFRRKKLAEQFAQALRGQHLQVRFQEDKPEVSAILDQDLHISGALQLT